MKVHSCLLYEIHFYVNCPVHFYSISVASMIKFYYLNLSTIFKHCQPFLVILEISFDPMKVVSDAVEEITDRRNMFLSYLSDVLMQDKGDSY